MVHQVLTGRGRGISQILDRWLPRRITRQWLRDNGVRASALPRDLSAAQWVSLFAATAAVMGLIAFAVCIAAVVLGIVVMTSK